MHRWLTNTVRIKSKSNPVLWKYFRIITNVLYSRRQIPCFIIWIRIIKSIGNCILLWEVHAAPMKTSRVRKPCDAGLKRKKGKRNVLEVSRTAGQSRTGLWKLYLSKIFPSYLQKNATEASCYILFFHGIRFLSLYPAIFTLVKRRGKKKM